MEELLREAACLGNLEAVQKLLHNGIYINAQHSMNGWTALHWACKRGHVTIVQYLLQSGADVNLKTCKGESVADVASNQQVLKLLQQKSAEVVRNPEREEEPLPITPNYISHPPFPYYDVEKSMQQATALPPNLQSHLARPSSPLPNKDPLSEGLKTLNLLSNEQQIPASSRSDISQPSSSSSSSSPSSTSQPPLVVKVRLCRSGECDFVEVEVPSVTYQALLQTCCEELEVNVTDVAKIRKLPNVLIRKDRDIQRMKKGQELEIVMKNDTTISSPDDL